MRIVLSSFISVLLFISVSPVLSAQDVYSGLIVIPPNIDYKSVADRADMTEILALLPEPDPELRDEARFRPDIWATDVRHVRDVWCLQFSFKRIRIIEVDIPNASGHFDRKKVWYLVYNVKNLGPAELDERRINSILGSSVPPGNEKVLPVPTDRTLLGGPRAAVQEFRLQTGLFAPKPGDNVPIRFIPNFILATNRLTLDSVPVINPESGETTWDTETHAVAYTDQYLPLALVKIKERERMPQLETTVSISDKEIAPGDAVWGVAMWTDIDPRINEFSIFVTGLTNAYLWANRRGDDGEYENKGQIGEGRIILRRVLKTDWWRVGDRHSLNETQIHYGAKDASQPESILDQNPRRMTDEEREAQERAIQEADINKDDWVSPAERAIYHLYRQDWLKPSFGYEWIFL